MFIFAISDLSSPKGNSLSTKLTTVYEDFMWYSINEIYHITNKVIVFQVINEDEMLKLLKSYQLQEYDEELAQNRACGVVAITKSRENCLTFLRLLENNPNLVRDDICYDLMSTNEGDIVMSNIKHVEGFDNAKIKLQSF